MMLLLTRILRGPARCLLDAYARRLLRDPRLTGPALLRLYHRAGEELADTPRLAAKAQRMVHDEITRRARQEY